MLLAMFERLTATVLSAPEASTAASRLAIASKRLAAGRNASPVSWPSCAAIRSGNSAWVLIPVPSGRPADRQLGERARRTASSRRMPCSTCAA